MPTSSATGARLLGGSDRASVQPRRARGAGATSPRPPSCRGSSPASTFEKSKTNFSVSTCCCSSERSSISSSIDARPIDWSAPSSAELDSSGRRLGHLLLGLPAAGGAEVVHREVVRDPEEPGGERRRAPAELADRLEHLQERLRRQVLGVVPVADAHVQVAVDPVEVDQVELFERVAVALLAELDEPPNLLVLGGRASAGGLAPARRSHPAPTPRRRIRQPPRAEPDAAASRRAA